MRDSQVAHENGVRTFVVGEHDVLWSPTTDRLVAVSDTSRLLWSSIDGTRTADDLVDVVAGRDADENRRSQVLHALDDFAAAGLLAGGLHAQPIMVDEPGASRNIWPVPEIEGRASIGLEEFGPFAALDWRFTVRCASDALQDELRWFLEPLRSVEPDDSASATPVGRYLVDVPVDSSSRSIHVYLDDVFAFSAPAGREALEILQADVAFRAVSLSEGVVVFHAAAVCRSGITMILPAESGSGKTSLAAALVASGWTFITDELAAVEVESHSMIPFRRAIVVSVEVAQTIGMTSESRAGARSRDTRTWVFDPRELEAFGRARPLPASDTVAVPTLVVAPKFVPGADLEITEMSPLETFRHLVDTRFSGTVSTGDGLALAAELANKAAGWRIVHGDAARAAAELSDLSVSGTS